jgi:NADH-quinone oxidoreductase subunit N
VAGTVAGREALLVYLLAYLFMNLGIFASASAVTQAAGSEALDSFRGLARRAPGLALVTTLFLLSLAGLPPLFGFLGKFLVFGAAVAAQHPWLAAAGLANSAVALYYYVNLIRLMYVADPGEAGAVPCAGGLRLALGVCAAGTLVLGVLPGGVLALLARAAALRAL